MDYLRKINYPTLKQKMTPLIQTTKRDVKETVGFYKGNAKYGWERGRKLARLQNRNPIMTFLIKTISTISRTRIRPKDITPLVGAGIFTFTNPIPGMGLVGFALGKGLHKTLATGFNALKSLIPKIRIK